MHRTVPRLASFASLLFLTAACSGTGPSARVSALLGGPAAVSVIADRSGAVRREAFRIDGGGPMGPSAPGDAPNVQGYAILAGPVPVDDESAATLADVLLSDSTYMWNISKACAFMPGIAFRETRDGRQVDVLVCFGCDELAVWVDGTKQGREDMDPRRADLVRIAKRLFPGDEKFRTLK